MPPRTLNASHLDANEAVFLEGQLTQIAKKVYEREYPLLEALRILPVTREFAEWAETISWFEYDAHGIAQWIANYADDLPRVDVSGQQFFAPVRGLGDSYGYSVQDVRRSAATGINLEQRKANAARDAVEQFINRVGFYGDDSRGIKGLFTTPNTNIVTAATAAASPNGTSWTGVTSGKTPDEIILDMSNLVDSVRSATSGVHVATTLVIPADRYTYIKNTPRSAGSDKSILQWFLDANPGVEVMSAQAFQAVTTLPSGASGTDHVAMAYVKNVDLLGFAITKDFMQHAPQQKNLEFVVPCEARVGGLIVWKPLTISFMEGV